MLFVLSTGVELIRLFFIRLLLADAIKRGYLYIKLKEICQFISRKGINAYSFLLGIIYDCI